MNWFILLAGVAMAAGSLFALHNGDYKVAILSGLYAVANVVIALMGEG